MNKFTITFPKENKQRKSQDFILDFHSVQEVKEWFENKYEFRPMAITKH